MRVKIGDIYNYLKVIKRVGTKKNKTPIWECECLRCGNTSIVSSEHLKDGSTKSCGCYRKDYMYSRQKEENTFKICGDYTIAYDKKGKSFIFDTEDLEKVKKYYWSVTHRGYVKNSKHRLQLHRYLLNTPHNLVVDHRNHITTDNRKCNIWSCTQSDNMYNQKRFHKEVSEVTLKKVQKTKMNPKEVLNKKRSYCDTIQKELEDKGVDFFSPSEDGGSLHIDSDYLSLPQNITDVSARDLGEYLNAFTQQKMYMRTLVGYSELFCEEARREYLVASEPLYKELLGSKLSETAKERVVNSDPSVTPFYEKYVDFKNKIKLLNLNINSIEEAIFMLSREVSRRTGDYENERRDYNVQRR